MISLSSRKIGYTIEESYKSQFRMNKRGRDSIIMKYFDHIRIANTSQATKNVMI